MRPTSKIGRLVRFSILIIKSGMARARSSRFAGSPAFTKWNVARVLTLGVLLSVGMAMYFNMVTEGVVDVPTTVQNLGATPGIDSAHYPRQLNNEDEWRFGPSNVEDFRPDSVRPISKEALAAYQRDDDEWLYHSPFRRNRDEFSPGGGAKSFSIDATNGASGLPEDIPDYHQQRVADSLEERLEAQRVQQKILGE